MRCHLLSPLLILMSITACGGMPHEQAPAGGAADNVSQPPQDSGTLPQSGQGNGGGVLSQSGQAPAAGVEATMSFRVAQDQTSGAQVQFHNGALTGISISCERAGGGAVIPECAATNAQRAFLVNELQGRYAYAGAFSVEGFGENNSQSAFVAIHAGPGMQEDEPVRLPGGSAQYAGAFQGGAGLTENGTSYAGRVTGTVEMTADFSASQLSGTFDGILVDEVSNKTVALTAGFDDAVIGLDGRFFNDGNTTFAYAGQDAFGELDGAFYGPSAEEAAGTFSFGNDLGGMTGILLGCSEYNPGNCVAPPPRF